MAAKRGPKYSGADLEMRARIEALEAALEQHKAESERAYRELLMAFAETRRTSRPPPKT